LIPAEHQHQVALDGVDAASADVFRALRRTFLLQRQLMEKALAAKGSHPGEAMCVRLLDEHEGMSQRDLADTLHLSRPRVTAILQRLEKRGAVVRRADERDQRLTRVALTAEGRRLAEGLRTVFVACITRTIGGLSEDDRRELERLLGSLAENTARALDTPPDR
jgi:MarR family transcriptional regulator, organic hydroperoxide resistance regulator